MADDQEFSGVDVMANDVVLSVELDSLRFAATFLGCSHTNLCLVIRTRSAAHDKMPSQILPTSVRL